MSLEDNILIERYLKNELSKEETQSFLERLDNDADFKAQVTLEKQLWDALDENSWSFLEDTNSEEVSSYESLFRDSETARIQRAITEAQEGYNEAHKPTRNWLLYVAVAASLILTSILIFNPKEQSNQELFASYLQDTSLLSLVDRGEYDSIFNIAQTSFDQQEYNKVVQSLSTIADSLKSGNVYIYLAISQIQTEQYSNAEQTLNDLINSDLLDSQKGYWYKSLLYLKSDQVDKTKKELQTIIDSSFYQFKQAQQLLKELK